MTIDVFFDFICPWCWIGTRHLASALNTFATMRPDMRIKVRWRSYPLLPDTPAEGMPYQAFYLSRLGSPTAVSMRQAQVQRAGQAAGIAFDFSRIRVLPNTQSAHALVRQSRRVDVGGRPEQLIEQVFRAYFLEGEDIGNADVLRRLEAEYGAAQEAASATPGTGISKRTPAGAEVPGVPYFVFNDKVVLSGALPPATLFDAMQRAASPQP